MNLARSIYSAADRMPKREEYRLTSQMIRAAISIPANIAEGHARATRKDYAHFISIARGSTAELERSSCWLSAPNYCPARQPKRC
jgi:four helix bundle protein